MNCRTNCSKTFAFALLALALLATPAFAGNCLQDEYNLSAKQKLGCTANDVRVAKVINVRDPISGKPILTCTPGTFSFLADFLVETTSTSSRSNIGLYFQKNPEATDALTGTCSDNILTPANDPKYEELDPQTNSKGGAVPDNCGDTSSTDTAVCLDANNLVVACSGAHTQTFPSTQVVSALIKDFICPSDLPNGTQLSLPNCTSWQIPGGTIQCNSNDGTYESALFKGAPAAVPGTPSKCNCATIPLGITVQQPDVTVAKDCTITGASPAQDHLSKCTLTPEGGDVVYTVTVTNKSSFGTVTVNQVCDDQYGQIYTATGVTPSCAKGALCSTAAGTGCANSSTCSSSNMAGISTTGSCTFTVTQAESKDITDTVNVSGVGDSAGSFGPRSSGSVEVVSNEAPSTAKITKGLDSTVAACATERYTVDVANTGTLDEDLTLTGLSDSYFGSITTTHGTGDGAVVGTTCSVPQGPLAAGTGDYKCTFDGQFCHTFGSIVLTAGKCSGTGGTCTAGLPNNTSCNVDADCNVTCMGIQNSNKVSGSFTGDEGTSDTTVTVTNNTFTVNECFTLSTSSTTP